MYKNIRRVAGNIQQPILMLIFFWLFYWGKKLNMWVLHTCFFFKDYFKIHHVSENVH